jgi:SAM-dependent methyltransferase
MFHPFEEGAQRGHWPAAPNHAQPGASRISRSCPCCGEAARRPLRWGKDGWETAQCLSCEFVYTTDAPGLVALAQDYEWSASFAAEGRARKARSPILARIDAATRWRTRIRVQTNPMDFIRPRLSRGAVLDVGCGNGNYLAAHAAGYRLHGIDISPPLAKAAHALFETTGGGAICAPATVALAAMAPRSIDAAILRSYLEHEAEPLPVLQRLREVLKPGGFAVVKVPNYASLNRIVMGRRWCGFRFPDHLNHFTPATLSAIAVRAGFETEWRWRDRLPTDDNMWCVMR